MTTTYLDSATHWLAWAVVFLPIATILYRLYFHPLSNVPGPKIAAVSVLWYAHKLWSGQMFAPKLHEKYGHVVRIAPNEVIFDSPEAFQEIYRAGSPYNKASWYFAAKVNRGALDWLGRRTVPNNLSFLSETNLPKYRHQRRLVGNVYSASNMKKFKSAANESVRRYVTKLKTLGGREVDLGEWMHILAFETLAAVVLSYDPKIRETESDNGTLAEKYLSLWQPLALMGCFPNIFGLADYLPFLKKWFPKYLDYTRPSNLNKEYLPGFAKIMMAQLTGGETPDEISNPDGNLWRDLTHIHESKPEEFKKDWLQQLGMTNFGAGHDTIASSLTSVVASIAQRPEIVERVKQELRDVKWNQESDAELPYLEACMKEAMRLHPVVGISMAREVPDQGVTIHGHYLPPRTVVGCNPFGLHRNKDTFGGDAAEFRPERWLGGDEQAKAMDRVSLTWGGASRSCPGQYMARMIMSRAVPALLSDFDIEVSMERHPDDMQYFFLAKLTGVNARFKTNME